MSYEVRLHLVDNEIEGADNYILEAAEKEFENKDDAEIFYKKLVHVFDD